MPDYSLGRAHGKIEIDYDGSGADRAARDLDRVERSSESADKSLEKTQRTLQTTERNLDSASTSAQGYSQRLKDVEITTSDVEAATRRHNATLLDSKSTLDDIKDSEDNLKEAIERRTAAVDAARDAHRAHVAGLGGLQRAMAGLSTLVPDLNNRIEGLANVSVDATNKASGLATALGVAARAAALLGQPAVSAGLLVASQGIDRVGTSANTAGSFIGDFVGQIASFEVAFGKIAGLTLAVPSLGGLAGIGGAAGLQGIVNVAGAVQQLSGVFGLLPAVVSGVAFTMSTLELAFRGVDDALTSMMDDDPTKFLESIKDMAPGAAQAMLSIAQFRDEFKLAAAAPQEAFFGQISEQIAPLIQTWLPAVASGMAQVAGVIGQAASELMRLLMQPQAMAVFQQFIGDISAGLQAMIPALDPLLYIFEQLTVAGSGFFEQIGGSITGAMNSLADIVEAAASSGRLQDWIGTGINAFGYLIDIVYQFGSAFLDIMTIADQFGGGGLLGWLSELTRTFAGWTQTADGQNALINFFSTMREATDAFLPMLAPLMDGLVSLGSAFVQLGIATAPGWQTFFDTFAQTMEQLAPTIVGIAPAINTFLVGMADAFSQLMAQLGPQLPQLFQMLADAFVALLPQIGPLVDMFMQLVLSVGPQLPKFFQAVTALIEASLPYWPVIIGFVRNFVSILTWFIESGAAVINWFTDFLGGVNEFVSNIPDALSGIGDAIQRFFSGLPGRALEAGKNLIGGLVDGITSGLGSVGGATRAVVEAIAEFFQSSPAKRGPFSGSGYTLIRGQKMITDMAAGMAAGRPALEAAALSSATAASAGLTGGAPTPGGSETQGAALVPDNIAGADTSVLTTYLRRQFSDTRGLKGLAKDLGEILTVAESGFNFLNTNVMQPMFQALGMLPGAQDQVWQKMSDDEIAARQQQESQRKSLEGTSDQEPTWGDVLGPGASSGSAPVDGSVPLVQNPDGTWTSPNPEWAKLIARESGGRNVRQQIIDANSGGNEAEGLFQITPATWRANGGADFAPNALAASAQEQAAVAARILRANPSGSDWGAGLPGRESAEGLMAGLTGPAPAGAPAPTWGDVLGTTPRGSFTSDQALLANVPAGRYTQDERGDLTQGLADCSSAVEDLVNMMDGRPTGGAEMWTGNAAEWLTARGFQPGMGGPGDFRVGYNASHMQATLPGGTPFNWGSDAAAARRGIGGTGADDPAFTSHYYRPVGGGVGGSAMAGMNGGLILPSGRSMDELLDTSAQSLSVNEQLLQAYLDGNPMLAGQLAAAGTPGASDATVMSALTGIDRTIADLTAQDAAGNQNTIDALRGQQTQLAQQGGFTQGPGALQTAQSIAGGAANAITGVFRSISSGLEALSATQDIADRLVYGVRNTEDINKIVDNVQKYITFAADIVSTVGSVLSTVGSFTAGSDFGGTSAAGSALSMISGVMQGVNAAIDFGQQVYEVVMGYVGRFMTVLTGLGGAEMMGNVGFLLNQNTGQLLSYSMDNPENKSTMNVPGWMNDLYGYGNGNANPQVSQELNLYAGPGMSVGQTMNEFAWLINTQGTTGALSAAAF
ncbi:hypothetical protein BCA37_10800 [Mycobacterium sp. djl-10]|nr:hypothetical protein BCA37_10800 [Mycobacterium sp. djl-10]